MDIQQASDPSIEVHFASQDARAKKRALAHLDNFSNQAQTIHMRKPSNAYMVAGFNLRHG